MDNKVKEKINKLKADGHSVYSIVLASRTYIYRSVNRKEFRSLQDDIAKKTAALRKQGKVEDDPELENDITKLKEESEEHLVVMALVDPEAIHVGELESLPAGVVSSLSELILQASAFGSEAEPQLL